MAATPRLIASMAEGERAATGVAEAPRVGGGENSEGLGGSLGAQPATVSAIKTRMIPAMLAGNFFGLRKKGIITDLECFVYGYPRDLCAACQEFSPLAGG